MMSKKSIWITVVILLLYFVPFTSGLWYWASGTKVTNKLITPFSWALSAKERGFTPIATKGDTHCIHWILESGNQDLATVSDSNGLFLLTGYEGRVNVASVGNTARMKFMYDITSIPQCYVFLTNWDVRYGKYIDCTDIGLRIHIPYRIDTKPNGELWLYVYEYKYSTKQMILIEQPSLIKEVFRSGNSVVYEKIGDINQ
jgi:hypothetical protein